MQLACTYDVADYKFTGKERDSESGLDNFGARYHGMESAQGKGPRERPRNQLLKRSEGVVSRRTGQEGRNHATKLRPRRGRRGSGLNVLQPKK